MTKSSESYILTYRRRMRGKVHLVFHLRRELPTFDSASMSRNPRARARGQSTTEGNGRARSDCASGDVKETPSQLRPSARLFSAQSRIPRQGTDHGCGRADTVEASPSPESATRRYNIVYREDMPFLLCLLETALGRCQICSMSEKRARG